MSKSDLTCWFVAAFIACCSCMSSAQSPAGEKIEFASKSGGKSTTVVGYLSLPENSARPVPAMVLISGSGGVGPREARYTKEFNKIGIAAFTVDSFAPRGIASTVQDQARLTSSEMVADAYGALEKLSSDPRIDRRHIGIIGASKGGAVVMKTAIRSVAASFDLPDNLRFAAHVALAPACDSQYRTPLTTGAPILMLLASNDDWTGIEYCLRYAEIMKKAGANIEWTVYPDAEHDFDGPDGRTHFRAEKAQNFSKCLVYIQDDGSMTDAATGEVIDSPRKYVDVMSKHCMTIGASAGTNPAVKEKSLADIRVFLKDNLLTAPRQKSR